MNSLIKKTNIFSIIGLVSWTFIALINVLCSTYVRFNLGINHYWKLCKFVCIHAKDYLSVIWTFCSSTICIRIAIITKYWALIWEIHAFIYIHIHPTVKIFRKFFCFVRLHHFRICYVACCRYYSHVRTELYLHFQITENKDPWHPSGKDLWGWK